ncbi:MAG: hypothetical protein REJ23_01920 [Brevundimonas sp.]|nr:hypothetical protein [Brevundimonas sp.]
MPLADPIVTTTGHCGETAVSASVDGRRGRIAVKIGGESRDITGDIAPLETEARGRSVARTYIACRPMGGMTVTLLIADQRNDALEWIVYPFSVDPDLTVVNRGDPGPLEGELADYFD